MSEIISRDLSVGYDNKALIKNIQLEVTSGRIVALIGPNGAGKSTILKTVSGLLDAVDGTVLIDEKSITDISSNERAQKIAVMMTGRNASEYMRVDEVVAGGRYPYTGILGKLQEEDQKIIDDALTTVGAAELKEKEFIKLSDGQKQRVLLARAIAQRPKFMILDEPTSFLDVGYKLSFLETIKNLSRENNIGILMSMHELEMAQRVADVVVCISKEGLIDKIGTPAEVFKSEYIEKLFDVKPGLLDKTYRFDSFENPVSKVGQQIEKSDTRYIMVQGTMSSAGKSLVAAGLCRLFKQDGFRVSPFKSQNMALNSFITEDGLEMGRAQVMQAEAAGVKPSVFMNPILLKPTSDSGSQVIVNGRVIGNMKAADYFNYKTALVPEIIHALKELEKQSDIIVIEGAGSPAEINLKDNDIVNMGMANIVDSPVLLVGDIDRGGVFAQLLGTLELLDEQERGRVKGIVINKFRGDRKILEPGLDMLEKRGKVPVVGVIPYMHHQLEDEDSLSEKFERTNTGSIVIGVVRLPHISNFTDFDVFEQFEDVAIRYISKIRDIDDVDMVIIPGSKNTISDMAWLKESGLEPEIKKFASKGNVVMGICGGYQMLGEKISDPLGVECGGEINGLGLLDVETVLAGEKHRCQFTGTVVNPEGRLKNLKDKHVDGYEIHMGNTQPLTELNEFTSESTGYCKDNIYGTYIHGIFDNAEIAEEVVRTLARIKGVETGNVKALDYSAVKEKEYDRLADIIRQNLDMEEIYKIIGVEKRK